MNCILDSNRESLPTFFKRAMYESKADVPLRFDSPISSSCFPINENSWQRASTFSAIGGSLMSSPNNSCDAKTYHNQVTNINRNNLNQHLKELFTRMQKLTIGLGNIFCLNNSAMNLIFPRVRRFKSCCFCRSSGPVISFNWARMLSAPSNSVWQVFSRTLLKPIGFPSGSSGGNSGSPELRCTHNSAYIKQNVGSITALSNASEITP